jgi:hypothetical protein
VDVRLEGREVQILPVFESRDFRLVGADEVGQLALETGYSEDIPRQPIERGCGRRGHQ